VSYDVYIGALNRAAYMHVSVSLSLLGIYNVVLTVVCCRVASGLLG
jgi:hypothetical protein